MQIAVVNQKGGVGKTTVSINVAGALNAAGEDVLLVDLDPQGHASEGLGFEDTYWDEAPNLFTAFTEDHEHVTEIVRSHQEMDVIPSNIDLTKLENALLNARGREYKLRRILDHVEDDYDHIILDCPPNLGTIADNAVLAAENILIPVQAEQTSSRALEILFESQVDPIEDVFESDLENGVVNTVGIIANKVQTTDNESREMMEWFDDTFPVPLWMVLQRVALRRAWDNTVSIFEHDEDCDVQAVFEDIAREIISGDAYAPDAMIAFRDERGSVEQYIKACGTGDSSRIETDGGRYRADHISTGQMTLTDTGGNNE